MYMLYVNVQNADQETEQNGEGGFVSSIILYSVLNVILKLSSDCLLYTHRNEPCFNSYEHEIVPIFHYRDKTQENMFYFLNISTCIVNY